MGVTPAAIGVWPPSPCAKNLDFWLPSSPKEVISLSADDFAMLRCGPLVADGGDRGGERTSGMLGVTTTLILWKLTCAADGDVHGSEDSWPVQAKL